MRVMGAFRKSESYAVKLDDFEDLGPVFILKVLNTKTKITHKFSPLMNFTKFAKRTLDFDHLMSNVFFLIIKTVNVLRKEYALTSSQWENK